MEDKGQDRVHVIRECLRTHKLSFTLADMPVSSRMKWEAHPNSSLNRLASWFFIKVSHGLVVTLYQNYTHSVVVTHIVREKGGHFAALDNPDGFVDDMRNFFGRTWADA